MKKKILLTSAGGLTGVFLTKHLIKYTDLELFCIDMTNDNPLPKWTKNTFVCPSTSSPDYGAFIQDFVHNYKIDIIIPVSSYDVTFFSKESTSNLIKDARILVLSEKLNLILSNKKLCYFFLNELQIMTPKIYNMENVSFPCFIKPEISSGSKLSMKIESMSDLLYWTSKINDFVISEYIEGKEYTVDCFFDLNYICKGYNVRERIKTSGGGVTITQNVEIMEVQSVINKLNDSRCITGPVNFQFKLVNNIPIVFDFNTRLASGGLPLTVYSGFDIPRMIIDTLLGMEVADFSRSNQVLGWKMIRYYEEYYEL